MSINVVLEAIKEHDAKFVDLRFTDIRGKEQHITIPVSSVDKDFVENGKLLAKLNLPTLIVQEGGYKTRDLGINARHFFEGLWEGFYM